MCWISIAKFIVACKVVGQSQLPHTQFFYEGLTRPQEKNITQISYGILNHGVNFIGGKEEV